MVGLVFVYFFFSSRRRHTSWNCDWSSDVCSSDLINLRMVNVGGGFPAKYRGDVPGVAQYANAVMGAITRHFGNDLPEIIVRSEERRVGKECRWRWER